MEIRERGSNIFFLKPRLMARISRGKRGRGRKFGELNQDFLKKEVGKNIK